MVSAHGDRCGGLSALERALSGATPVGAGGDGASGQVQRHRGADHRQARRGAARRLARLLALPRHFTRSAAFARGAGRGARMNDLRHRSAVDRGRRRRSRWSGPAATLRSARISAARGASSCSRAWIESPTKSAHQVLVPDGMGGFIHIDHLLLTPRGLLVLDTRRVAGSHLRRRSDERLDRHRAPPLHLRQSAACALRSYRRSEGAGRATSRSRAACCSRTSASSPRACPSTS